MKLKIFLLIAFIVLVCQIKAQVLSKLPVQNIAPRDTSNVKISLRCPSTNLREANPLLIIDGKRFQLSDLSNIYFKPSIIKSMKGHKNIISRIKYGRAAKSGIILVKTKSPIKWVTFNDLSIKNAEHPGVKNDLLFIIDGKRFTSTDEFYIDAGYIKSVNLRIGTSEIYNGKNYNSIANIELEK